jgi:hypothetical protein
MSETKQPAIKFVFELQHELNNVTCSACFLEKLIHTYTPPTVIMAAPEKFGHNKNHKQIQWSVPQFTN